MAEETLRRNLDRAIAPPPDFPDPRVLSRTMAAITGAVALPRRASRPQHLRIPPVANQWAAAVLVLVLAGAAAAAVLALHHAPAPVRPTTSPIIFPTKMISPTTGWAITSHGTSQLVWRTTDGGVRWSEVTPHSTVARNVYDYTNYFLDGSHAWITEREQSSSGASGPHLVTLRTTDGGQTWQLGAPISTTLQAGVAENFLDANSGWLVMSSGPRADGTGWPDVYATTDGGLHWSLEASGAGSGAAPAGLDPGYAEPTFVSTSTGWLTVAVYAPNGNGSYFSRSIVLVTHDGGRTWHSQALPIELPAGARLDAPQFFGPQQGVMWMSPIDPTSSVKPVLLATSDGGAKWTARPLEWPYIWSIQFVDRNHGFAVAGPGSNFQKLPEGRTIPMPLYRTDDGGVTWTPVATTLDFRIGRDLVPDVHFVDQRTGFATVLNDSGPYESIRSDDSGLTWRVVAKCRGGIAGLAFPPAPC